MLNWVVKVVPQPPEPPPRAAEDQREQKAAAPHEKKVTFQDQCRPEATKAEQEAQAAAENSPAPGSQPRVLTWISEALPQAAVSPKPSRANPCTTEETAAARKGMMAWIAEGLEKVVPRPDVRSKESSPAEPPAEVCHKAAAPAAASQVVVVEVQSDKEESGDNQPFPPRMISWIKQGIEKVVPQPEIHIRAKSDVEQTDAATKPQAPPAPKPAADTDKSSKEAEQQPNMMGWIVSGIGRMLPQPVLKQDAGSDQVHNISIVQNGTDLVLEDVEQEEPKQKVMELKEPPRPQNRDDLEPVTTETEDAEAQTDCLVPLRDIKREAGEAAQIEERLQQERLEAARVAEEMARKAAEEAVRQLEVEHSAKIVIETLPESSEQLPNILEEENEDEPESLVDVCPAEDVSEAATRDDKATLAPTPPTECEPVSHLTPPTDVQPAPDKRDQESPVSQPVSQQPGPQAPVAAPTDQTTEEAGEGDGCGAPGLCSPIKSFLLRFPCAAECLERCRKLMHERYLTPPTLSMPPPPPELAQLTQELWQLPKQARRCCTSIASRLRRLSSKSQQPQQP